MSIKHFQVLINQVGDTVDYEFGFMNEAGLILASSNNEKVGKTNSLIAKIIQDKNQYVELVGQTFQKVYTKNKIDFISYIASVDKDSMKLLSLISINAANLKNYNEEKYDKNSFIKSIITGNIVPGDILLRARELHIEHNTYRTVFLIKSENTRDPYVFDIIQGIFPNKVKDFICMLDNENVVLVKELKSIDDKKEIEKTAKMIIDTLSAELMVKINVGVGNPVDNIKDIVKSFHESQTALDIGKMFENDKPIIYYNNLGIGRLIYHIPRDLCRLFLKEVFGDESYEALDAETLYTIQKFFENNLNVSETSRQLYVHRNTLVYRLDKILKLTGLDLRNFDDAIIFKVAVLVKKYVDSMKDSDFN